MFPHETRFRCPDFCTYIFISVGDTPTDCRDYPVMTIVIFQKRKNVQLVRAWAVWWADKHQETPAEVKMGSFPRKWWLHSAVKLMRLEKKHTCKIMICWKSLKRKNPKPKIYFANQKYKNVVPQVLSFQSEYLSLSCARLKTFKVQRANSSNIQWCQLVLQARQPLVVLWWCIWRLRLLLESSDLGLSSRNSEWKPCWVLRGLHFPPTEALIWPRNHFPTLALLQRLFSADLWRSRSACDSRRP